MESGIQFAGANRVCAGASRILEGTNRILEGASRVFVAREGKSRTGCCLFLRNWTVSQNISSHNIKIIEKNMIYGDLI
jgi:hypothetical protein